MCDFDDDPRLENVASKDGKAAMQVLISEAKRKGYHLSCGGTMIPHIQSRQTANERPYSYSLLLNPVTPTFYVRRPIHTERQSILNDFKGAHEQSWPEIKIPVPDASTARSIAERFL